MVKSLRGGNSSEIDISLTYEKNTVIDIVQFKRLSPLYIDFEMPNLTSSDMRISKVETSFIGMPVKTDSKQEEIKKWLRHKTYSGSYFCRI